MNLAYLDAVRGFSRNARLFLLTLALASLIIDGVYSVIFNLYLLRLGYDPAFIGQINSAGLLTFALASMPAGALGQRWGSRRAMIAGLWVVLVGSLLLPFAGLILPDLQELWLFVTYVTMFLGYAIFFVNGVPFLMSTTRSDQRNHAFSVQTATYTFAAFVGGLLGGLLPALFMYLFAVPSTTPIVYRLPLWMAASLLVPGIWAALRTTEVNLKAPAAPGQLRPMVGPQRRFGTIERSYMGLLIAVSVVRILQVSGMAVTNTFFNVYMDQSLHVPTAQIGLIAAAARLLAVPGALLMASMATRWGNRRLVIAAGLSTVLSLLPLALMPWVGGAALGFIGVSVSSAIRYPAFLVFSMELVREDQRQTMSGLSEMTAGLCFAAMALLGGYLITAAGYTALFLTGALLAALGTGFFVIYFRRPRGVAALSPAPLAIGD